MRPDTTARRRQRILDAATDLFAHGGYAETTMDDVAAATDVAKPTLYRYFPTKEALFLTVLERVLAQTAEEVSSLRGQEMSHEARLRGAIRVVTERISRLAPALQAVEGKGRDLDDASRRALRAGFRNLRDQIRLLLADGMEAGAFARVDADLAALAIVGALRMTALVGASKARGAGLVADLLLNGLARAPAAPADTSLSLRDAVGADR